MTEIVLFCQHIDDDARPIETIFLAEISKDKVVAQLQNAIKAQRAQMKHIDSDQLRLWKLTIPVPSGARMAVKTERARMIKEINFPDPDSDEALEGNGLVQLLDPANELSSYWAQSPDASYLHLLQVKPIANTRGIKRKRDDSGQVALERRLLAKLTGRAPSSFAEASQFQQLTPEVVCCNRPFDSDTIPITLLQEEFGQFKDDCELIPSTNSQELLQALTIVACKWHDNKLSQRSEFQEIFREIADLYLAAEKVVGTDYTTDGHVECEIIPPLLRVCKNEARCALFEAVAYYAQFLKPQLHLRSTRFPCIIMVDIGPYLGFHGCLWDGNRVIVEPLTPFYDLTTHWMEDVNRRAIAAGLHALMNAVPRIQAHYAQVRTLPVKDRKYPYKTDYQDASGQKIKFEYDSRVPETLVFQARTVGEHSVAICVKFTRQYSAEAHRFLAELGHAPQLRAATALPGGWNMIVMDHSPYVSFEDLSPYSRPTVVSKVKDIVQKLHVQGFVHGDIRRVNILVDPDSLASPDRCAIHIINFDWAGKAGSTVYPMRINTKTIRRPEGVSDGQTITVAHDVEMVNILL